jgi:hypothetical protein
MTLWGFRSRWIGKHQLAVVRREVRLQRTQVALIPAVGAGVPVLLAPREEFAEEGLDRRVRRRRLTIRHERVKLLHHLGWRVALRAFPERDEFFPQLEIPAFGGLPVEWLRLMHVVAPFERRSGYLHRPGTPGSQVVQGMVQTF